MQPLRCLGGEVERFLGVAAAPGQYAGAALWALRGRSDFGAAGASPASDAAAASAAVRRSFAAQHPAGGGSPEADKAVAAALERPHLFVLKPQREANTEKTRDF